jgi:hypothetical protein
VKLARLIVDALLERDYARSLQKSLYARALRLFHDGYTPEEIYAVVKKEGDLPDSFMETIQQAWAEFQRRGTS